MLRKFVLLALVVVSLVLVSPASVSYAAPATATTRDVTTIRAQLAAAQLVLRRAGYTIRAADWDTLGAGDTERYTGTFYTGYDYRIIAIGGPGIADLDIGLYDENSNLIDEDTSTDATPIVDVTPRWSGDFTIAIQLYDLNRGASRYDDYVYGYIVAYK